jgi:hypothetical protein
VDIRVSQNPGNVQIGKFAISSAPPIETLLQAIGGGSWVDAGATPAPTGHRNNQIHVYDELGIYIHEHHHTRRAICISLALDVKEAAYRFIPKHAFKGELRFNGKVMPLGAGEAEFVQMSPFPFQESLKGSWFSEFEGFSVNFTSQGRLLPSGTRSRSRRISSISISWPHDPHQAPG